MSKIKKYTNVQLKTNTIFLKSIALKAAQS